MKVTGTSSIVGVLTLEVRDPFLRGPSSISIKRGETIELDDELRFQSPIVDAANRGLVILTLESSDEAVQADLYSANFIEQTISGSTTVLPASPGDDYIISIKNSSDGDTTVSGNGHNIESDSSIILISGECVTFRYNGTKWLIVGIGDTLSYREQWVSPPPATSGSDGIKGQMAYDGTYIYICVDTDTWIRYSVITSF